MIERCSNRQKMIPFVLFIYLIYLEEAIGYRGLLSICLGRVYNIGQFQHEKHVELLCNDFFRLLPKYTSKMSCEMHSKNTKHSRWTFGRWYHRRWIPILSTVLFKAKVMTHLWIFQRSNRMDSFLAYILVIFIGEKLNSFDARKISFYIG